MAGEGIPYLLGVGGLLGIGVMVLGVALIARGVRHRRRWQAFAAVETTTTASADPGDLAKLRGTAREDPGSGTITGGFTGETALAVRHEIADYRDQDSNGGHDWEVIHEDVRGVAFRLVDDDGSIAVDPVPDCLDLDENRAWTAVVEAGDPLPLRIGEYVQRAGGFGSEYDGTGSIGADRGRRKRFREAALRPGDELIAFGRVVRAEDRDWGDSLVVVPDPDDGGLVTDRSEASLSDRNALAATAYLAFGVLLVMAPPVVGLGVLASLGVL